MYIYNGKISVMFVELSLIQNEEDNANDRLMIFTYQLFYHTKCISALH